MLSMRSIDADAFLLARGRGGAWHHRDDPRAIDHQATRKYRPRHAGTAILGCVAAFGRQQVDLVATGPGPRKVSVLSSRDQRASHPARVQASFAVPSRHRHRRSGSLIVTSRTPRRHRSSNQGWHRARKARQV